ncbi:hypothetical protein PHLCEN_2v5778 [Hermanssonia centrifuga]|uniref:Uncharacterized protein n=1 Tax=Hermanssonia centrifuga TaxID=98765 RepID=A0A2R6P1D4_9APHY|nr:hypothetical protein PHLCEN_2v5778 [Hermanssonia centrifuga]
MEVHLLGYMNNTLQTGVGENSAMGQALLAFSYLSLFLSISAAMSSLVLTDELGEVPLRASRSKDSLRYSTYDEPSDKLLTRFNGGRCSWRWVMWHWLFNLVTGYVCIIVQLVLYVWSSEQSVGIKGAVTFIAVFSSLPLFDLFLPSSINRTISAASPGPVAA